MDDIAKKAVHRLLYTVSHRDQARLLELSDGLGHAWMTIPPSEALHSVIAPEDYCLGLRWHLGLDIIPSPVQCLGCTHEADTAGDHYVCCPRNNFAARHNAVKDALYSILSTNGEAVAKEVALAHSPDTQLRPADLLLPSWQLGGPTALDVTVVHGWSQAQRQHANPPTREKWRSFLKAKEASKHLKYDTACGREGWHFQAIAIGTWGGLGPEGSRFLTKMLKRTTSWQEGDVKSSRQSEILERLGFALMTHVWALLKAKNFA